METAKPALSSAGEVTFEPEDKRASDWLNMALDWASNVAVDCADMFVFITILTLSVSRPVKGIDFAQHPCCVADLYAGVRRFSFRLFVAAGRLCYVILSAGAVRT
jgi:hypothetical protein